MGDKRKMTEEEIRPIAEDYVEEYCHCSDGEYTDGSLVCAGIGTALIVSRQLEKRIAELEKENAELNETLGKCAKTPVLYCLGAKETITKAKEHIKKLLDCLKQDTNDPQTNYYVVQYMTEAEQFLNSEVEK
jgi:hypothetical protein